MNDLVVFKNEMNSITFQDFNSKEVDLFFAICSQMREKGTEEVVFSFSSLKNLSNYKITSKKHFLKDLENVHAKLIRLSVRFENEEIIENFLLFNSYRINKIQETITIGINKKFEFLLNEITGNFTKFELNEFVKLNSNYSKTAYKQLKQFRKKGMVNMSIEEFREKFCIPSSYKISNIEQRVFNPIREELSHIFKNLEIDKIKKGKKVARIAFSFLPEDDMLPNGKYRLKKGKEFIEKAPTEMSEDEVKKVFP